MSVAPWDWPFAIENAAQIEAHWEKRRAALPALFNGTTYLLREYAVTRDELAGTLFQTDFKTLLYWRANPSTAHDGVREAFGTSLIRSAEGHVLLGRQGPGQVTSGLIYQPGGIFDGGDVTGNSVDIEGSIAREVAEETGLSAADFVRVPGFLVALAGIKVAIGIEWRSALPADALRGRILDFLARQTAPELADIVIATRPSDIDEALTPLHARMLLDSVLSA
ncbi:MAG TPA: hypothetical protein VNR51_02480 [Hyphomicrobium sp.]|nr:hypothetical protein [Hyphomicrobium sp.]